MLTAWFLQHHSAPLLLAWAVGAAVAARQRRLAPLAILAALVALGVVGLWPHAVPGWLGPLVDLHGVSVGAQWGGLAALLLLALPRQGAPGARSLLAALVVVWQGAGAALAAAGVAGRGALEPGQPRRAALLLALLLTSGAAVVEDHSLTLWAVGRRNDLGWDQASVVVDTLEQAARLGGWAAALTYALPGRGYRQAWVVAISSGSQDQHEVHDA